MNVKERFVIVRLFKRRVNLSIYSTHKRAFTKDQHLFFKRTTAAVESASSLIRQFVKYMWFVSVTVLKYSKTGPARITSQSLHP